MDWEPCPTMQRGDPSAMRRTDARRRSLGGRAVKVRDALQLSLAPLEAVAGARSRGLRVAALGVRGGELRAELVCRRSGSSEGRVSARKRPLDGLELQERERETQGDRVGLWHLARLRTSSAALATPLRRA